MPVDMSRAPVVTVPANTTKDSISALTSEVESVLRSSTRQLRLDCSELQRTTSTHIRAIIIVWQHCCANNVTLSLESMSANLVRVLRVLDLHELLTRDKLAKPTDRTLQDDSPSTLDPITMTFKAASEAILPANQKFTQYLLDLGLKESTATELQVVFHEIVSNIVDHSEAASRSDIVFTAEPSRASLKMTFTDSGQPFDMTQIPDCDDLIALSRPGAIRGYGIAMIRRLTHAQDYHRDHDGNNTLTLHRNWKTKL